MNGVIEYQDLGFMPYREALSLQDELREARIRGKIADRVLLIEHPPVLTTGRQDCREDFLSTPEAIAADGIEIVKTDRGGRVTYHGPGQLVVYFICELAGLGMGIREFVFSIEEACLRLLTEFGIEAKRDPEHPGLWVGRNKIVAVGMHVAHGVTQHGLALNVDGDLSAYRHIVACGVRGRGVTSIKTLRGDVPEMGEVKQRLIHSLESVLGRRFQALVNVSSSAWGVSSSSGGSS